ncbi:hypothetical protein K2173_000023 [Erythroxylum novogranatense]|uniref:Pentatricopeptide repeat-containing protein-mitochondrial domain-containing protein n=1 Tax=Erythroxylum novogranatense TaxID=1862640 RepID=A0AAV8SP56_9ROSI|nr:hypothetical protein K2173_000023 [Erythroxylum novogranatense]
MGRSLSFKGVGFFLRKHRRWPHSPYKARWHLMLCEQQAMQTLKQEAKIPPSPSPSTSVQHQGQSFNNKPHLLSSLIHSFSIYNCEPTPQAYLLVIKTLAKASQLHLIPSVLDHLKQIENFETPEFIIGSLIQIYGHADKLQEAIDLFYRIPEFRCVPTVYSLNALLSVLCESSEGLKLVPEILLNTGVMNIRLEESTLHVLITSLCRIKKVEGAIEMFNCMVSDGFSVDDKICSFLMSSFCGQKDVTSVQVLGFLGQLKNLGFSPGMRDYTNVIKFLVKSGMGMDALDVLDLMKSDGIKPDIVCYTMVLNGVIAIGDYLKADELFDELLIFGLVPDVNTYNVYINGLCKQNKIEAGIKMAASMEELGCRPNLVTYNTLLDRLFNVGEVRRAKELVRVIRSKSIELDVQTYKIMVDGLTSNGEVNEACALMVDALDKGLCAQSLAFDELICGLCRRRLISEAFGLLDKLVEKNASPGVRAWEELLLSSELDLDIIDHTLADLAETKL